MKKYPNLLFIFLLLISLLSCMGTEITNDSGPIPAGGDAEDPQLEENSNEYCEDLYQMLEASDDDEEIEILSSLIEKDCLEK